MADANIRRVWLSCKRCGQRTSYVPGRGKAKVYCGSKCASAAGADAFRIRHANTSCSVAGCDRKVKNIGRMVCAAHEARMIRTGSYKKRVRPTRSLDPRGYVKVKAPGSPVAGRFGWCYEHRLVAYAKYGEGPLECHWCGKPETWQTNAVDHLDEDKSNNAPSNLVVACNACNRARGAMLPFVRSLTPDGFDALLGTLEMMRGPWAKGLREGEEFNSAAAA